MMRLLKSVIVRFSSFP